MRVVSRRRLYMFGVLMSDCPIDQLSESFVQPRWVHDFGEVLRALRITPLPLARFLLLDDDEEVSWAAMGHGVFASARS